MYSFFLFSKSFPKCEKVFTYIYDVRYFRKDAHAQAASLRKTSFSYINIFCLAQSKYFHRTANIGKLSKNKTQVTWDISHNFACVSIFFLATLHGNKIVQYFQNYKCMDRNHFRKRLQSFTKSIKVDFKTTRTIFKDHAILG